MTVKTKRFLKRWDGTPVPVVELGQCREPGCTATAYTEKCNAEGDENRAHWHGAVHTVDDHLRALCPEHAEQARQAWRDLRAARK